ncbi:uncharacterized protein MELLADRAFT_85039 [Melampsora larici-populina 98AG31]|uniref:HMG box domain-containing protein n=1 Tax=Melampsora larici-populina (strain 98AG31 / pathotype 3-4-7) TaxID=747676 RepID=F4RH95_MELLP|nr:uncharacterized protein MELLADRAFT_85039 [Melampsora larici-populina 98AG31]EGG08294.1 hypothetical protein MELLADRAFT_85039 [Melampsora larici-populina 98AG31]
MTQRTSPTTLTTPAWNSAEQTDIPNLTKQSPQSWSSASSHHSNLQQHSLIHHHQHSEKSPPLSSSSSPASPSPSSSSVSSSRASINSQHQVEKFLKNLGLSEYIHIFLAEGFDTMISIEAITEDDMEHMSMKRGHRRVLQRALSARGTKIDQTLPSQPLFSVHPSHLNQSSHTPSERESESGSVTLNSNTSAPINSLVEFPSHQFSVHQQQTLLRPRSVSSESTQTKNLDQENWTDSIGSHSRPFPKTLIVSTPNFQNSNPKRKYQRHPKPDLNAPEKPLSAYVMFSNQVREELKGQQISFTEIARLVGDRWKNLCPRLKDSIINRAAEAKNVWSLQMDQYKKTPEYVNYQVYVKEFKANNGKSKSSNRPSSSGNQPTNSSNPKPKINSLPSSFHKPEEINKSEEEEEEEEEELEGEGEESSSESEVEQQPNSSSKRIKLSSIETHLPFLNILKPLNTHHHHQSQPNSSTSTTDPMNFPRRSSTNNTFFENNSSRGMRLPVDLRHLTSLASSSSASSKDSKV